MKAGEILFTGQTIMEGTRFFEVVCPVCEKPVNLRGAWIDPYFTPGKEVYVHHDCLSEKRLHEIEEFNQGDGDASTG